MPISAMLPRDAGAMNTSGLVSSQLSGAPSGLEFPTCVTCTWGLTLCCDRTIPTT
jgi:hypothetical protein